MRVIHEIVSSLDFSSNLEELIYSPSYNDMTIECIDFVPGETKVKDATNYTTIGIFDMGESGTEYDLIALITNNSEGGVDFVKNIKLKIELLSPIVVFYSIVAIKFDNAAFIDLGQSLIILRVRET